MERELILLAPKDSVLTAEDIEIEKGNMKKLFPYIESFNAFLITNEILDVVERKKITGRHRLLKAFCGELSDHELLIICNN
jgi:hypothetical protein